MVWPAPRCRTCWQRVLSCSFIGLNRRLYNAVALSLQDRFGVHWRVQFALTQPVLSSWNPLVGVTESDADLVR